MFARRRAAFTIIEILVSLGVVSITIAAIVPRLTSTKNKARATAVANDLRTFAAAFDVYAHEKGAFPADTEAGELPPEIADRIDKAVWLRPTAIGGQYNWESGQLHGNVRYKAAIQISETTQAPLPQDVDLWETLDRVIDDGNLATGNFRLGANDEPIFIIAQ